MGTNSAKHLRGDMTQGPALPLLLTFALPLIGSQLFQQFYNLADTLIIGQFLGVEPLAGVSSAGTITQLLTLLGSGAATGANVIVGQFFGAGQYKRVKTVIQTALITFVTFGLILLAAGTLGGYPLLQALNTPEHLMGYAYDYLSIYALGMPFVVLYNVCNSIFNGMGDSRKPLMFLIFSSVLNVALDLVFVAVFHWGVAGAAIATVISQALACALAFAAMLQRIRRLTPEKADAVFDKRIFLTLLRIGIPSMLQMASVAIGAMLIQSLVNPYGSSVIAGYAVATKICNIATSPIHQFGFSVSTFTAQNLGMRQFDRPKEAVRAVMKIMIVYVLCIIAVFGLFGKTLIGLFDSSGDALMLSTGYQFLMLMAPFYFLYCWSNAVNGVSRGAGFMLGFMVCTMTDIVCRIIFAHILNHFFGILGVFVSFPLGWIINAAVATYAYKSGKWKKSLVAAAGEA